MSARGSAKLLAVVVSAVVATVVIVAIVIIDPPTQRLTALDERRVEDLQAIEQGIDLYWREHQTLPSDLTALFAAPGLSPPKDPESGAAYEYERVGERSYRLCVTFARATSEQERPSWSLPWAHRAGRFCFDRKAGPDPTT